MKYIKLVVCVICIWFTIKSLMTNGIPIPDAELAFVNTIENFMGWAF